MTTLVLIGVLLGYGAMLWWMWSLSRVARRPDDDLDRYFREQQARTQLYGCATRASRHVLLSEYPAPTRLTTRSAS